MTSPPPATAFPAARQVVQLVGGSDNVEQLTHCMVRLRFVLADPSLADDAALQALPDVLMVVRQAGQLQLAVSVPVTTAYRALRRALDGS